MILGADEMYISPTQTVKSDSVKCFIIRHNPMYTADVPAVRLSLNILIFKKENNYRNKSRK